MALPHELRRQEHGQNIVIEDNESPRESSKEAEHSQIF
jgi:hypothetical protein